MQKAGYCLVTGCAAGTLVFLAFPHSLSVLLRAELTEASPALEDGAAARRGKVRQAPEGMGPWGTANAWRDGGGGKKDR